MAVTGAKRGRKFILSPYARAMLKVKVDEETGCWVFHGMKNPDGYGLIRGDKSNNFRMLKVHRVVYEKHKGKIPWGSVLAHSCDNRPCCNPDHLSAVSQQDNIRDMVEKGRHWIHRRKAQEGDAASIETAPSEPTTDDEIPF